MNPVFYDTRGFGPKAKKYKDAIRREFPDAEEKQLPVGDLVCGNASIEIKTVPDFLSSITDGRLRDQPIHLKENFTHPLILVLGTFTDLFAQNILNGVRHKSSLCNEEEQKKIMRIHENAILGAVASIVVRHKIPIMMFEDINIPSMFSYIKPDNPLYPQYTVDLIKFAQEHKGNQYHFAFKEINYFFEKANDGKLADSRIVRRGASTADKQVNVVTGLPGIKEKIAINLLTEFGSIRSIFNQSVESLTGVDKIGTKRAQEIYDLAIQEFDSVSK